MSTAKSTAQRIVKSLKHPDRLRMKPMFGEYALYADDNVIGLICNDTLYLKIVPASKALESMCVKEAPYEGSKPQYLIKESQFSFAGEVALKIAEAAPKSSKPSKR